MLLPLILPLLVISGPSFTAQQLESTKRLEAVVRQIERAKDKVETNHALVRYKRVIAERDKAWEREYSDIEKFRADNTMFLAKWHVLQKRYPDDHDELRLVAEDLWIDLLQKLHRSTTAERVSLLRSMAIEARKDFSIDNDQVFFGPWCGTYDHTYEHKIDWAARRYLDEAVQALSQIGWEGRTYLMKAIQGHENWKSHAKVLPVLQTLSVDRNTLVRGEALLMLGSYSARDSQPYILEGLSNRAADTRAKALRAAAQLKLKSVEPTALRLTKDNVIWVSNAAIEYIVVLGTQAGKDCLLQMLRDGENLYSVLNAVSEMKLTEAVALVEKLLSSSDDNVRKAAARTLENLKSLIK